MALILLWVSALAVSFALTRFSALSPLLVALALPGIMLLATLLLSLAFPPTSSTSGAGLMTVPLCVLCGSLPGALWGAYRPLNP